MHKTLREAILIVTPNVNIEDLQLRHPELTDDVLNSPCIILPDNTIVMCDMEMSSIPFYNKLDIENIQMPKMVDYVRIDAYNRREERRRQRETFRNMGKYKYGK